MFLGLALNFHSHEREKIASASGGIGVIRYLSKQISCYV